jgi:hypothetical protein
MICINLQIIFKKISGNIYQELDSQCISKKCLIIINFILKIDILDRNLLNILIFNFQSISFQIISYQKYI